MLFQKYLLYVIHIDEGILSDVRVGRGDNRLDVDPQLTLWGWTSSSLCLLLLVGCEKKKLHQKMGEKVLIQIFFKKRCDIPIHTGKF